MAISSRSVLSDVTNVMKDTPQCSPAASKSKAACVTPSKVTPSAKNPLSDARLNEKRLLDFQDVLDEQAASDDVLQHMRHSEKMALRSSEKLAELGSSLPQGAPARNAAVWICGHLVEHVRLPESKWLDAFLLLDAYCIHRPNALDSPQLPAICAAIVRLVKKFDDAEPSELFNNLHTKAASLAQWMNKCGYPHLEAWPTYEDLNKYEEDILSALNWTIKLPTVQDWMTVLCARLNVFTRHGLMHLLTPIWQHNFQLARMLTTHCPTTASCSAQRVAQGLLCLSLVSARVLPADTFGLDELAVPAWDGAAGGQQCKQESLAFLLQGLQDATGSDVSSLKADTHLVNETLLILRASAN